MTLRPFGAMIVVPTLLLSLAACGTDEPNVDTGSDPGRSQSTQEATDASTTPTNAPTAKGRQGAVAELRFTSETLEGDAFDGTTLAGKDAVLWFWAPWCTECRREAPHVAGAQEQNPDVTFVGVAGLGETEDMRAFVDDYDVDGFEHVADLDGSLWQRFGVVQQPAYAFVDDSGTVEVFRGELGEDGLAARVAALTGN